MQNNKQFELMAAFGIIFMVLGHTYQPSFIFYPSYYFQFPLILFVCGYFLDFNTNFKQKLNSIYGIVRYKLLIYYLFNFLFLAVYFLFKSYGVENGLEIGFYNFFVEPFVGAHQFWLISAAWFIPSLCVSSIILHLIVWKKSDFLALILLLLFTGLIFFLSESLNEPRESMSLLTIKVVICCFYLLLGYNFKKHENVIRKYLFHPLVPVILIVLIEQLRISFGDISIYISQGNLGYNSSFAHIVSSISIILLIYMICHFLTLKFQRLLFIENVIKYSSLIAILHLFCFTILNLLVLVVGRIYLGDFLNVTFRYQMQYYWTVYAVLGLAIPIYLGNKLIVLYSKSSEYFNFFISK